MHDICRPVTFRPVLGVEKPVTEFSRRGGAVINLGASRGNCSRVQKVYRVGFLSISMGASQRCIRIVEAPVVLGKDPISSSRSQRHCKGCAGKSELCRSFWSGRGQKPSFLYQSGTTVCHNCIIVFVDVSGPAEVISLQAGRARLSTASLPRMFICPGYQRTSNSRP